MINIAHVIETIELGGAENLLSATAERLNKGEFRMIVIHLFEGGALRGRFERAGIKVFNLSLKRPLDIAGAVIALRKIFMENRIDIVHTHLFYANIYGRIAAKMAGVSRVITTLHNPDYSYEDNGRATYKIRRLIDRYTGLLCNSGFIAVSGFVRDDYKKNLGFKNIEVLHNAIDTAMYSVMDAGARARTRREFGVSDADLLILNIGRLHRQKGQRCLIEAFHAIKKSRGLSGLKLVIIGSGGMEEPLKEAAREAGLSGSVSFFRNRPDIPSILQASDIFVLPSDYEGFGMALVEAMAAGLPVIASDIPTLREIVADGDDGILVARADPHALAGALIKLAGDRDARAALGKKAGQKVREKFEISVYARRLEDIYRRMTWEAREDNA